jgi:deoxyribonuclease V
VKTKELHAWQLSITQAMDMQRRLSKQVSWTGEVIEPNFIAGVDISVGQANEMAQAAIVVLSYPELKLVATELVQGRLELSYIPGLLSFRESPLILAACRKLSLTPDLIIVDGQGVAHPRRLGLASHLGLFLDIPTIGCAKSRLCGMHKVPGEEPGSYTDLVDRDEIIGVVLRTKTGVKPVYVSTGHKISLENAIYWVMQCCRGYRLPEPTRLAHLAAGGNLKPGKVATELGYQGRLLDL